MVLLGTRCGFIGGGAGRINKPVLSLFLACFLSVSLSLCDSGSWEANLEEVWDQLLRWRSSIPAVAEEELEPVWKQWVPPGFSTRTESISGRQGLAPHCVFSVNLSTKAMTQVQQTIQPTTHHVTPGKTARSTFCVFPPFPNVHLWIPTHTLV